MANILVTTYIDLTNLAEDLVGEISDDEFVEFVLSLDRAAGDPYLTERVVQALIRAQGS